VLDRMGVHNVQQLLDVPRLKFRYLTGVGDRIRKEIRERAKRLVQLRPDLVPGGATKDGQGIASLDRLAEQLLPRRPAGDERPEDRILGGYLGLEPADGAPAWPNAGDVARAAGVLNTSPRSLGSWLAPSGNRPPGGVIVAAARAWLAGHEAAGAPAVAAAPAAFQGNGTTARAGAPPGA
ncbi:MAG: hypothetical protein ACREFP_04470, partial [Acetobacteraceae bacterium]